MTTRKAYEMAIRVIGLITLFGAITYGLYGAAVFAGRFAPGAGGFSLSGAVGTLAAALTSGGIGLAMILLAPGLARWLEPKESAIALPSGLDEQTLFRLALHVIGVVMAASALAGLAAPLVEAITRPAAIAIPGRTTALIYPGARLVIGLILVFHQQLLGSARASRERVRRSEEGDVDEPW